MPPNPYFNAPTPDAAPTPAVVPQAQQIDPAQMAQALAAQPPTAVTPVAAQTTATSSVALGSDAKAAKPTAAVKNVNSTQNTLLLSEVRDNFVIMADGSFRAIIACKSINFDLMSAREREGVELSYQSFLNSLNFPIQITVRSQRVDIGPYLDKLLDIRRTQDNMLLGVLMDDYINFIDILAQEANIMEKTFFISVPYFPQGDATNLVEQGKGFFGKLFAKPKNTITRINAADYQKAKDEIKNRVDAVMSGLFQVGVQSVQLNTKELSELYYNFYNPDTAVHQPLGNFEDVTSTFIRKADPGVQV